MKKHDKRKNNNLFCFRSFCRTVEVERDSSTYLKENNRTEIHCNIIQTTPVRQFLINQRTHYYDIMLYPDWKTDPDVTNVLTLQFADRTVTYINGVLQE